MPTTGLRLLADGIQPKSRKRCGETNAHMKPGALVYVARPKSTYGTARDAQMLALVRSQFSCAEVLDPAALFLSHEAWMTGWETLVRYLDAFVLFTAPDGTVGEGCHKEWRGARDFGISALLLSNDKRFIKTFHLRKLDCGVDVRRYARPVVRMS